MFQKIGLALLILVVGFSSCDTDFDLTEDFKEIPVVIGLLDQSQEVQYIRIQKAFIDEEKSALVLSQDPANLYYGTELEAEIRVIDAGVVIDTLVLERVDGDSLGLSKDSGDFATLPNILYRTNAALNEDHEYQLFARNQNSGVEISAQTGLIKDFTINSPKPISSFPLSWVNKADFRWRSAENGKVYDMNVTFYYTVYLDDASRTALRKDSLEWDDVIVNERSSTTAGNQQLTVSIPSSRFFNIFKSQFQGTVGEVAVIDSMAYEYIVGSEVLDDYIQISNVQGGLTSNNITPDYTNVSGGLGIFAARLHKPVKYVPFTNSTRDSLACGQITEGIGFAPAFHALWPNCP